MVPQQPASFYRRRVLAVGAAAALLMFVIGAVIFDTRIENDLESRVPAELAEAGITDIEVTFSGQDGTMTCASPVSDPLAAEDLALDVHGVHSFELDRSCKVNADTSGDADGTAPNVSSPSNAELDTASAPATSGSTPATTDDGSADGTAVSTNAMSTRAAATTATSSAADAPSNDFPTIANAIDADSAMDPLAIRLNESDLVDRLADASAGPFTVFAPTAEALDALSADESAVFESKPEIRDAVLANHIVTGRLSRAELTDGMLTAEGGGELTVVNNDAGITINGATIGPGPITADNGVVYPIDRLLIPDGVSLQPDEPTAASTITFADGTVTVTGVVADEGDRQSLVDAAAAVAGGESVVDELEIDPAIALNDSQLNGVIELTGAMAEHLVNGTVGFDGADFIVSGQYVDASGRDALVDVAEPLDAITDLQARPDATADQAQQVEDELNGYVAENPILFEPSSALLTETSNTILDNLANRAQQFDGVQIDVQGHTDSDGDADNNLILSEQRANSVLNALVERGLSPDQLTATGFGETQPVLVDGSEDKDASRRVVFSVTVA